MTDAAARLDVLRSGFRKAMAGSEPSVIFYGNDANGFPTMVWSDGNWAEFHPGKKRWEPLPRANHAELFPQDETRCMHADCRATAPADSTVCPKCFRTFR